MSELAATALMLLAMTVLMRHLFHPGSWLHAHLPSDGLRLLVDAVVSGAVVAALIASPPRPAERRAHESGGHRHLVGRAPSTRP
ncbi:hypothetical protein [Streptomyces adustus]